MCGVFGAVTTGDDAARIAAIGLFALQHRGQESAGIAASDGEQLMLYKDLGLIAQVLDERRLPSLPGKLAISHCRYSTTGSTVWENAQPTLRLGPRRALAIGHNGNLVNTRDLLERLQGGRSRLPASTDTELLTALLADEPGADTVEALQSVLPGVRGAYSLVVLDERRLIGVRDPAWVPAARSRPPARRRRAGPAPGTMPVGRRAGSSRPRRPASTSSAPTTSGTSSPARCWSSNPAWRPAPSASRPATPALCVFELIYFARPDSVMEGRNLYEVRRRMGMQLAGEHDVAADLVMPVPDTGGPAAAGYAEASGIPYREGMYRNRYAGRTFIQPSQAMRHRGVTVKLNPSPRRRAGPPAGRGRRLDRARHHHALDRRAAAQGRARQRSTSGSAPRRSTTPASTGSTPRSRPS